MTVTTAAPLLGPGEQPQATGRCRVGKANVGRNVAMMAASAILSGGSMMMYQQKKSFYFVLTSQRLLILEAHWLTSRPTAKAVADIPRHVIRVAEAKSGFTATVVLALGGNGDGLRLSFPAMDKEGADNLLRAMQYQAV